jgi:hypothetical protein
MDKVDIFLGLLILWNLIKDSVGKPFFGSSVGLVSRKGRPLH